jgi:hypothetical protein
MRDKKRAIDKFVTLNVQQISATLEQVRPAELAGLAWRMYLLCMVLAMLGGGSAMLEQVRRLRWIVVVVSGVGGTAGDTVVHGSSLLCTQNVPCKPSRP